MRKMIDKAFDVLFLMLVFYAVAGVIAAFLNMIGQSWERDFLFCLVVFVSLCFWWRLDEKDKKLRK